MLEKEKGIKDLVFDTCGSGYFDVKKGYEPEIAELNELLAENRVRGVKIRTLELVEVPKAEAVYEVTVAGLG